MYTIVLPPRCAGHRLFEAWLRETRVASPDVVSIDCSNVADVRPSGLGMLFVVAMTLRRRGWRVGFVEPDDVAARRSLRRSGFWSCLLDVGFDVDDRWVVEQWRDDALIAPCVVGAAGSHESHIEATRSLGQRLAAALDHAAIPNARISHVLMELTNNAAEHSQAPHGAFVMAQAFDHLGEVEVVVADAGVGISGSLAHHGFRTHHEAVAAALHEDITGRREPRTTTQGHGLPTVRSLASRLWLRSGDTVLKNVAGTRDIYDGLAMQTAGCEHLDGTVAAASIFTSAGWV